MATMTHRCPACGRPWGQHPLTACHAPYESVCGACLLARIQRTRDPVARQRLITAIKRDREV